MIEMRWVFFSIIGLIFLSLGVILLVLGPRSPVYWAGGGTSISFDGTIIHGTAPTHCEIMVPTIPNTLHVRVKAEQTLTVELNRPNGTTVAVWENETIHEDYVLSECGLWEIYIVAPKGFVALGEIYTTAPLYAHPALVYAPGPILLGLLSLLYSKNKRRMSSCSTDHHFEQHIGGRWVFLAWIPIFAFISSAPRYIPSYPWLYVLLIALTVVALFSSIAIAYVKLYVSTDGIFVEAPFLNFSKQYEAADIYGYAVKKVKKQRWFLLRPIPSVRKRKDDEVTISVLSPLPKWLWFLSFGTRLYGNKIIFRPKSLQNFTLAMDELGVVKKDILTS